MLWNIIFPGCRLFWKYLLLPIICHHPPPNILNDNLMWQLSATIHQRGVAGRVLREQTPNKAIILGSYFQSVNLIRQVECAPLFSCKCAYFNQGRTWQLPCRRLNDPAQMSPQLGRLPSPKAEWVPRPPLVPTDLGPRFCMVLSYWFFLYSFCLLHQTTWPMDTCELVSGKRAQALESERMGSTPD